MVEAPGELPYLLADVNNDGATGESERFDLSREASGYSNVLECVIDVSLAEGPFKPYPMYIQTLRGVRWAEMRQGERLVRESRAAFARGLVDFWGSWCPPCRAEMPYLRGARTRFSAKGFDILGMNTDDPAILPDLKTSLAKFGATWTQAKRESITELIGRMRISSFPTTILVGPDGKIISLNNTDKKEPGLRDEALLTSLAEIITP